MKKYVWISAIWLAGNVLAAEPPAKPDSAVWTKDDIANYCRANADGNPHSHTYESCLEHQERHLGRVKTSWDIQQLKNAKMSAPTQ